MYNLSIVSLSLALLTSSSYISTPKHFNTKQLSLNRIQAVNSFSPFLYSNAFKSETLIRKSKFSKFLSSAIKVENMNIENKIFIKDHQDLDKVQECNFSIIKCMFDECISTSVGGGLSLISNSITSSFVEIRDSTFRRCSSRIQGGAIYAILHHVVFVGNCFELCQSSSKQAWWVKGQSQEPHVFNQTCIADCGRTTSDSVTAAQASSLVLFHALNASGNTVSGSSAGFFSKATYLSIMKYSTFANNAGSSILDFQLRKNQTSIQYNNLVNNTAQRNYVGVFVINQGTAAGQHVFVQNSLPLFVNQNPDPFIVFKCIMDCGKSNVFRGNIINMESKFDVLNAQTNELPTNVMLHCGNYKNEEKKSTRNVKLYIVIILLVGIGLMYQCMKIKKTSDDNEDMIPLKSHSLRSLND